MSALLLIFVNVTWWWFLALLLAITEIEMEGKFGWASRTATAYRVTSPLARIYAAVMNGKPLTYWNLFMQLFLFAFGHAGYAFGLPFTWAGELQILFTLVWWAVIWDLLWFGLHPYYNPDGRNTWNLRALFADAWWHSREYVRGPLAGLPTDYVLGFRNVLVLTILAALVAERWEEPILACMELLSGTSALIALTLLFGVKPYQAWYAQAHRPESDERHLVVPSSHR